MSEATPLALALASKKCKRIKRNGLPCGNWARHGQEYCGFHGASAPQCLRAARRRLNQATLTAVEALHWAIGEAQNNGDLMPLIAACKVVLDRAPDFAKRDAGDVAKDELRNLSLEQLIARAEEQAQMIRRTLEAQKLARKMLGSGAPVLDAEVINDDAAITSTITAPVTSSIDTDLPTDGGSNNLHPRSETEVQAAPPKEIG